MNLVNRDRLVERLPLGPCGHPVLIAPGELSDVPDNRCRPGPHFRGETVRIRFLNEIALMAALDLEFVDFALHQVGDEKFPDSGRPAIAHRMPPAIPVVEIANHADALGVRRPDREIDTSNSAVGHDVGTEPLVVAEMRTFAQEVKVEVGQRRPEAVGVDEFPAMPFVVLDAKPVRESLGAFAKNGDEEAILMDPFHRNSFARLAIRQIDQPGRVRLREEHSDDPRLQLAVVRPHFVGAQDRKWVPMIGVHNQIDI